MVVKLLTEHHLEFLSLPGGCTGSSESRHVKMPHCWKSHVTTRLFISQGLCMCCMPSVWCQRTIQHRGKFTSLKEVGKGKHIAYNHATSRIAKR